MSAQDTGNVARGHKAAIHNPRISEVAKEHSRQVLDDIERGDVQETQQRGGKDGGERGGERGGFADEGKAEGRVLGGYKATLKNPRVSGEAKEHAKEVLDDNDAL